MRNKKLILFSNQLTLLSQKWNSEAHVQTTQPYLSRLAET